MWSERDFISLEQEERGLADEGILAVQYIINNTRGDIEKELRNFYQKYGTDGIVTYAEARKWISDRNHQRRLAALTAMIGAAFALALDESEKHFRRFLTNIIGKESTFFGVEVDIDKLLNRKWGVDDLYWLQRLEDDVNLWKLYVANDIKQAMLRGENLDDVLVRLNTRFTSINNILQRLGITEATAVGSMTRYDIFRALGVSEYRFYTEADERTCETCGAMHGLTFPMSAYEVGVTASPLHPRCRCWEVPILE